MEPPSEPQNQDQAELLEPDPVIEAYKSGIDRTLLRQNLRRTPEERFVRLMDLQRFAKELRSARKRATGRP